MTHTRIKGLFFCGDCKHHLCVRADMHTVICSVTLEFRDRYGEALCEYADRKEPDSRTPASPGTDGRER